MSKQFITILSFLFIGLHLVGQTQVFSLKNKSTLQPISYATVYFVELQSGTTTDSLGQFKFNTNIAGKLHLQISNLGYETSLIAVDFTQKNDAVFYLSESHLQLNEVVVSTSSSKIQQDNIVAVIQKNISELTRNGTTNLTEAISNIPGVDNYATGAGIGKPVIRGLSGNRIVTYAQNVRIENQQWGDEHGLGIGEIGIEKVEVIKGAASLLYGADAIGGVLFFTDERYAAQNTVEYSLGSKFLSNTLGTHNNVAFKINKNKLRWNVFGGYNSNADYQLPTKYRVQNTRFDEKNLKTSLGFNHKNWIGNLRYSYLQNGFGINESDTLSTAKRRNLQLPFQKINNHLFTFDNTYFLNKTKLNATFGYSCNARKEYADLFTDPNLSLNLSTFNYNLKSNTSYFGDKLNVLAGIQGMSQRNMNNAPEVLIPDALINDVGVYTVLHYKFINKLNIEGGLRFDNRNIDTKATQTAESFFPKLHRNFNNVNYALGAAYQKHNFGFKLNLGSGFRSPNTAELLSNGVHEGTLRYEIGDDTLKSEKATQIDLNLTYEKEHFSFYVNPFLNHINNYIYLSPTDSTSGGLPVFAFKQTKANLWGAEAGFHWHPHPMDWLHIDGNYSSVFAQDRAGRALPLIPANKIQTTIKGEFKSKGKIKFESVFIEHIYRFSQNQIAQYETTTAAYQLINAGLALQVKTPKNTLEITVGVKNLLNTAYIDHLSRFKYAGIYNAGRNVYVGLSYGFD
jgi:iron complex outermembrane recepter protein